MQKRASRTRTVPPACPQIIGSGWTVRPTNPKRSKHFRRTRPSLVSLPCVVRGQRPFPKACRLASGTLFIGPPGPLTARSHIGDRRQGMLPRYTNGLSNDKEIRKAPASHPHGSIENETAWCWCQLGTARINVVSTSLEPLLFWSGEWFVCCQNGRPVQGEEGWEDQH